MSNTNKKKAVDQFWGIILDSLTGTREIRWKKVIYNGSLAYFGALLAQYNVLLEGGTFPFVTSFISFIIFFGVSFVNELGKDEKEYKTFYEKEMEKRAKYGLNLMKERCDNVSFSFLFSLILLKIINNFRFIGV